MSVVKICSPSPTRDDPKKALPPTFIAVGTVPARIQTDDGNLCSVQSMRGYVSLLPAAPGHQEELLTNGTLLKIGPAKNKPGFLQWIILFRTGLTKPHRLRLTVQALGKNNECPLASATSCLCVEPTPHYAIPAITFPDSDNYQLEPGELTSFLCYGGSDHTILSATIGARTPDAQDWSDTEQFWWAEFDNLSTLASGTYTLTVTNIDGSNYPAMHVIIP